MTGILMDMSLEAATDVVGSSLSAAEDVFSNLWAFAGSNPLIMIIFVITVVGVGLGLFMSLKSKFSGKKRGKGRR